MEQLLDLNASKGSFITNHTVALKEDKTLISWEDVGQNSNTSQERIQVSVDDFHSILSKENTVTLKEDGQKVSVDDLHSCEDNGQNTSQEGMGAMRDEPSLRDSWLLSLRDPCFLSARNYHNIRFAIEHLYNFKRQ